MHPSVSDITMSLPSQVQALEIAAELDRVIAAIESNKRAGSSAKAPPLAATGRITHANESPQLSIGEIAFHPSLTERNPVPITSKLNAVSFDMKRKIEEIKGSNLQGLQHAGHLRRAISDSEVPGDVVSMEVDSENLDFDKHKAAILSMAAQEPKQNSTQEFDSMDLLRKKMSIPPSNAWNEEEIDSLLLETDVFHSKFLNTPQATDKSVGNSAALNIQNVTQKSKSATNPVSHQVESTLRSTSSASASSIKSQAAMSSHATENDKRQSLDEIQERMQRLIEEKLASRLGTSLPASSNPKFSSDNHIRAGSTTLGHVPTVSDASDTSTGEHTESKSSLTLDDAFLPTPTQESTTASTAGSTLPPADAVQVHGSPNHSAILSPSSTFSDLSPSTQDLPSLFQQKPPVAKLPSSALEFPKNTELNLVPLLKEELLHARAEVDEGIVNMRAREKEVAELKGEVNKLLLELEKARTDNAALDLKLYQAGQKHRQLESLLEQEKTIGVRNQGFLDDERESKKLLIQERVSEKQEFHHTEQRYEDEIILLKKEHAREVKALREKIEEYEVAIASFSLDISTTQTALKQTQNELQQQTALREIAEAEMSKLRQDLSLAQAKVDSVESEAIAIYSKQENVSSSTIRALEDQVSKLSKDLLSAQMEIGNVTALAEDRYVRCNALSTRLDVARGEVSATNEELRMAREKVQNLELTLLEAQSSAKKFSEEVESLNKECHDMAVIISDMRPYAESAGYLDFEEELEDNPIAKRLLALTGNPPEEDPSAQKDVTAIVSVNEEALTSKDPAAWTSDLHNGGRPIIVKDSEGRPITLKKRTLHELEKALNEATLRLAELEAELARKSQMNSGLLNTLGEADAQLAKLTSSLEHYQTQESRLSDELAKEKAERAASESRLAVKLASAEKELDWARNSVLLAQEQVAEAEAKVATFSEKLLQVEQKLAETEREFASLKTAFTKKSAECGALALELGQVVARSEAMEKQLAYYGNEDKRLSMLHDEIAVFRERDKHFHQLLATEEGKQLAKVLGLPDTLWFGVETLPSAIKDKSDEGGNDAKENESISTSSNEPATKETVKASSEKTTTPSLVHALSSTAGTTPTADSVSNGKGGDVCMNCLEHLSDLKKLSELYSETKTSLVKAQAQYTEVYSLLEKQEEMMARQETERGSLAELLRAEKARAEALHVQLEVMKRTEIANKANQQSTPVASGASDITGLEEKIAALRDDLYKRSLELEQVHQLLQVSEDEVKQLRHRLEVEQLKVARLLDKNKELEMAMFEAQLSPSTNSLSLSTQPSMNGNSVTGVFVQSTQRPHDSVAVPDAPISRSSSFSKPPIHSGSAPSPKSSVSPHPNAYSPPYSNTPVDAATSPQFVGGEAAVHSNAEQHLSRSRSSTITTSDVAKTPEGQTITLSVGSTRPSAEKYPYGLSHFQRATEAIASVGTGSGTPSPQSAINIPRPHLMEPPSSTVTSPVYSDYISTQGTYPHPYPSSQSPHVHSSEPSPPPPPPHLNAYSSQQNPKPPALGSSDRDDASYLSSDSNESIGPTHGSGTRSDGPAGPSATGSSRSVTPGATASYGSESTPKTPRTGPQMRRSRSRMRSGKARYSVQSDGQHVHAIIGDGDSIVSDTSVLSKDASSVSSAFRPVHSSHSALPQEPSAAHGSNQTPIVPTNHYRVLKAIRNFFAVRDSPDTEHLLSQISDAVRPYEQTHNLLIAITHTEAPRSAEPGDEGQGRSRSKVKRVRSLVGIYRLRKSLRAAAGSENRVRDGSTTVGQIMFGMGPSILKKRDIIDYLGFNDVKKDLVSIGLMDNEAWIENIDAVVLRPELVNLE